MASPTGKMVPIKTAFTGEACFCCCAAASESSSLVRCSSCQRARYCNSTCQRADWAVHKKSWKQTKRFPVLVFSLTCCLACGAAKLWPNRRTIWCRVVPTHTLTSLSCTAKFAPFARRTSFRRLTAGIAVPLVTVVGVVPKNTLTNTTAPSTRQTRYAKSTRAASRWSVFAGITLSNTRN